MALFEGSKLEDKELELPDKAIPLPDKDMPLADKYLPRDVTGVIPDVVRSVENTVVETTLTIPIGLSSDDFHPVLRFSKITATSGVILATISTVMRGI